MPTEGTLGDRRRIASYVRKPAMVSVESTVADLPARERPTEPVAVVDENGVLLGSLQPEAGRLPPNTPVARAMTPAPSTIRPELRVDEVAQRLRNDRLDHLFVTAVNGTLFGIVALDDLHA